MKQEGSRELKAVSRIVSSAMLLCKTSQGDTNGVKRSQKIFRLNKRAQDETETIGFDEKWTLYSRQSANYPIISIMSSNRNSAMCSTPTKTTILHILVPLFV